ncbi:hypothetical protein RRG08_022857 [Elysia crispata]|uniref:Uncharacterized protein n=1 Tax=Elysia crispata TaxID=231223 RepID=A0AAE1D7Q9_9GAST|nr:hypothetical protein RRG08_022857 [Elysia crispata]
MSAVLSTIENSALLRSLPAPTEDCVIVSHFHPFPIIRFHRFPRLSFLTTYTEPERKTETSSSDSVGLNSLALQMPTSGHLRQSGQWRRAREVHAAIIIEMKHYAFIPSF